MPDRGRTLRFAQAGGAKPIAAREKCAGHLVGWVGGVYPSAQFTARTAASDGQRAFTRAARSAGLRFAVIVLSKTVDVGRDHLIHRKRSPFPYEGKALTRSKLGVTANVGRGTLCFRRVKRGRGAGSRANAPLRSSRRGEAHRRPGSGCRPPCGVGWRGSAVSGTPPRRFPARTAASDGQRAFTRAARSAGLRFAMRSLSEEKDRENTLREGERV